MDINILDILNTGVTGFAFLMLYLGPESVTPHIA